MGTCAYCNEKEAPTFSCHFCGKSFCSKCKSRKKHKCPTLKTHFLVTRCFNPVFNTFIATGLGKGSITSIIKGGILEFRERKEHPDYHYARWLDDYKNNLLSAKVTLTRAKIKELTAPLIDYAIESKHLRLIELTREYLDQVNGHYKAKLSLIIGCKECSTPTNLICNLCNDYYCPEHYTPEDHDCREWQKFIPEKVEVEPSPLIDSDEGKPEFIPEKVEVEPELDFVPIVKKEPHFKIKWPSLDRTTKVKIKRFSKVTYKILIVMLKVSILVFLGLGFVQPDILNRNAPDPIKSYVKSATDFLTDMKIILIDFFNKLEEALTTPSSPITTPIQITVAPLSTTAPPPITIIPPTTIPPTPNDVKIFLRQFPEPDYNNPYLIAHVKTITKDCFWNDSACKLYKIHNYVIENFDYKYTPYKTRFQPPAETLEKGYGVCIDFAVQFYNYLRASGIETYVVDCPDDDHAYAIACNINLNLLRRYADIEMSKLSGRYVIPKVEFEVNQAFGKECLHLEGPPEEKDEITLILDYPGRYIEAFTDPETGIESPLIGRRYAIDPITKEWDEINKSEIYLS